MIFREWVRTLAGARFGFTHDLVFEDDQPYLERWIIWFGFTLRLHRFHKGDDERAFHDHPWWFVTIPLQSYRESTPDAEPTILRRFHPHYRSANHRHIVQLLMPGKPVWTIIITGPKSKEWGFWDQGNFIHHSQWLDTDK